MVKRGAASSLARLALNACFAFSMLLGQHASAGTHDPDIEYSSLSRRVGALLVEGDFGALDSMAEQERVQRSRFTDGRWMLTALYDGMHPDERAEPAWLQYEKQLKRWIELSGRRSPTPHVALASFYISRGWQARGTGYAREVRPEAWRAFRENLDLARRELTGSATVSKRCPHWFNAMQEVALGQGWPAPDYEALFQEAVAREPTYYFYYFSKANYYQSRWYGNRLQLQSFVDDAVRRTYKSEGYTLYARIYWSAAREFGDDMFAPGNVDWAKMKAGFQFMESRYPASNWNRNALAHFACLAGDKVATAKALQAIGDKVAYGAWNSPDEVRACKQWSLHD